MEEMPRGRGYKGTKRSTINYFVQGGTEQEVSESHNYHTYSRPLVLCHVSSCVRKHQNKHPVLFTDEEKLYSKHIGNPYCC